MGEKLKRHNFNRFERMRLILTDILVSCDYIKENIELYAIIENSGLDRSQNVALCLFAFCRPSSLAH